MNIERLELFGYIRLMLTNVQRFVYTPESLFQIILGTNGSGKSSILAELSPLPAQSGQYSKDGYKKVWIRHKGVEYVLESSFRHGNKHSFKKDGEELNPGGTGMVQKELCKREFNYTQELHELLTGETSFTDMAPMKRREWITMLDAADYTYPLWAYNKLRTLARDNQGTLKHLKQRLATETNNLRALSDTEGMEDRAHQLHQELNALLTQRLPNLPTLEQSRSRVYGLLQRIEQLSDTVLRHTVPAVTSKPYRSTQDVVEDLQAAESELSTTQTLLTRSTTEFGELEAVVSEFSKDGEVSLENVDQFLVECDGEIERLRPRIELFRDLNEPELIRRDNEQILDLVMHLFSQLPDNGDRRYSRESSDAAKQRIREHERTINLGTVKLQQIAARLQLINSAKDTQCPDCGYTWREGYSEEEVAQNEQWQAEHQAIIEHAERQIQVEQAFLEESDHFSALYTQFRGYVNNYPRLKPLWDHILQNKLLLENPARQHGLFMTWRRDVELNAELVSWQHKRQHAADLAERQKRAGGSGHLTQRLARLNDEIDQLTNAMVTLQQRAKSVRQYRDRMLRMEEAANQLEAAVQELEKSHELWINATRNQLIDETVHTHQIELAGIQHRLTEQRTLAGVVADLSRDHDEVDLDFQVFSMLARELSPDEGLIAEQLSTFIGTLVAQLNSVIEAVWTYDLRVLSCGMESGDLDYKFPMQVAAADREVPDISKGSKGMKAMVNFAFQLTVMLYMGMEDYPLFLDEPGEGFDEQHRTNLMSFIKQLMDSGRYSQLFMISHFATSHGAFLNAQVLVLDSSNIAVPSGFNQHVLLA
jgi:hypothetical protein